VTWLWVVWVVVVIALAVDIVLGALRGRHGWLGVVAWIAALVLVPRSSASSPT